MYISSCFSFLTKVDLTLIHYLWQIWVEIEYYSVEVKIEFNVDVITSELWFSIDNTTAYP